VPTQLGNSGFSEAKGATLAAFASYALCRAQEQSASLGFAPLPINLVQAGFAQIAKIPGALPEAIDMSTCVNPTFSADGTNLLAQRAPQPLSCDRAGLSTQCPNGTGGLAQVPTPVSGGDTGAATTTSTSTTTTSTTTTSTTTTTTLPRSTTTTAHADEREERRHRTECARDTRRNRARKCDSDRRSSWFQRPTTWAVTD
jgi:hypothetical protein